jgi:hypothetical protein
MQCLLPGFFHIVVHRPAAMLPTSRRFCQFDYMRKEVRVQRAVKSRNASSTFFRRLAGTVQ